MGFGCWKLLGVIILRFPPEPCACPWREAQQLSTGVGLLGPGGFLRVSGWEDASGTAQRDAQLQSFRILLDSKYGSQVLSQGRGTGLKRYIWTSGSFAVLGTLPQKRAKNHTTRVLENIGLLECLFQRESYKTKYLQARRGLPKLDRS